MEFNQLLEDCEGPQKRRTEFDSPKEKLTADAKSLIAKAGMQHTKLGIPVDPITFAQRADDDIEALREAIKGKQEGVNPAVVVASAAAESVEVDPRFKTFRADFDADPKLKSKISWTEIRTRLLANEGHYLALAQAMEQGGQLFGIDTEGRPLISDRGDEPIMKGMNYENTRDRVKYKYTSNDINGTKILDENNQSISTGYEMFGYNEPYEKSDEINQYETHTGKHFVQSPGKKEWRSSWLESGVAPSWPRVVNSNPGSARSSVYSAGPKYGAPNRGVRRLLRVEKDA